MTEVVYSTVDFDFIFFPDVNVGDCAITFQYPNDSAASTLPTPTQGWGMHVKFINYTIDLSTNIITLPNTENNYIEIINSDKSFSEGYSSHATWEFVTDKKIRLKSFKKSDCYILTSPSSLDITFLNINITFLNMNKNPFDYFVAIHGYLDTTMCANGDYVDISIPVIYENLKNFYYSKTIFDNILYKLATYFPSIALKQRITERIKSILQRLFSGEINLDEFNVVVKQGNEEFASEYRKDYEDNYIKLKFAIEKNKSLLN